MSYEEKDMKGSLFNNDRKKSENSPDLTGKALVHGQPLWVYARYKVSKAKGIEFIDLSFQDREPKGTPQANARGSVRSLSDGYVEKRTAQRPAEDVIETDDLNY